MKKNKLYLVIGLFVIFLFSSCVKTHTCECYFGYSMDHASNSFVIMGSKKTAKKSCEEKSTPQNDMTCKLK